MYQRQSENCGSNKSEKESMMGMICGRDRFEAGSERERKLVDDERGDATEE